MPIEEESPEQFGYDRIRYNLSESSVRDRSLADLGIELPPTCCSSTATTWATGRCASSSPRRPGAAAA